MKLRKIEFENFRNFKEKNVVRFSTDGKVTIIYGNNGSGKTTFHQLFQWIIYGNTHFNKTATDKLYNLELYDNKKVGDLINVYGSLDFEHANNEYSIRREWIYKKNISEAKLINKIFTISIKDEFNNWSRVSNPDEFVEQVLPSGLSQYFFFDGESMIADLKQKGRDSAQSLRDSMYLLLDLNVYNIASDIIGRTDNTTSVLGMLFLDKSKGADSETLDNLNIRYKEAIERKETIENKIEIIKQKNKELNDYIKIISEQIGSVQTLKEYEKQRNDAKCNKAVYLESAEKEYKSFGVDYVACFSKLMISKTIDNAKNYLKIKKDSSKVINGLNKEIIDSLLKEDKCICGNILTEKEKKTLKDFYKLLPPQGYGSIYNNFEASANEWRKSFKKETLTNHIRDAVKYSLNAEKQEKLIKELDKKIVENKKYEELINDRIEAEKTIAQKSDELIKLNNELSIAKTLIRKLEKDIREMTDSLNINIEIDSKIEIMNQVKQYFDELKEEKSCIYSKKLQNEIQYLLNEMLEAKRTVNVNNEFSLKVSDNYNDESKSEGQFATVSFAYIGGIFKLLQQEPVLKNKEYPLVLDAPFSKLGTEPRMRVAEILPQYAPQIIILSKDDLSDCFSETQIGLVYTITSNESQNVAKIEEGILW